MTREPNLTPATLDEWLTGLDVRLAGQRPGQWAVNTLPRELWRAINCTPFDAYHIGERLPDLIRYARHWWGVMECDRDWAASIPVCVVVAVKRGKVPGDIADCAPELVTDGHPCFEQLLAISKIQAGPHAALVASATAGLRVGFACDQDEDDDGEDVEMERL
jgi:hypothetical protein